MPTSDKLPERWSPDEVAVGPDPEHRFLLRPGQILAGAGDEGIVAKVLGQDAPGPDDPRPFGVARFTIERAGHPREEARRVLAMIERIRRATADRPEGPARVGPNHVLVGEAGGAVNFRGEPRIQGGCGSTARVAPAPKALPHRASRPGDGKGVSVAVLDTGLFDHPWLPRVRHPAGAEDVWDADADGYADAESGHGTFIAGLILQVAPAADVQVVKVLNSEGVGDDFGVAQALAELPEEIDIVNLSLGGYTVDDAAPLAISSALRTLHDRGVVVVAAAGNWGDARPFWPAAFKQVLAVGAVERRSKGGPWLRADFSDHGWWVDAAARGVNVHSTFSFEKTLEALGPAPDPGDPTIVFDGWAAWDGTSFSAPLVAGVLARLMSRQGLATGVEAQARLLSSCPPAPQPDFPLAVMVDEQLV